MQGLNDAIGMSDEAAAVAALQRVLDRRVLVTVHISPESRVRVEQGAAPPELVQGGTRLFLVKVLNDAGVTAPLAVASPNIGRVFVAPSQSPEPKHVLTEAHVRERWADMSIYTQPPMRPRLSGLGIEYVILQVYSRDAGQRSALVSFNVGQGSQDVGFRNDVEVLFTARPSHAIKIDVKDEHGRPTTAGFTVRDELDRIYPNISKRLAPDFYFQPQVYRHDGQAISLPAGEFTVTASRGPEYIPQTRRFSVAGASDLIFRLLRWIDPSQYGWYSGDHHIHSSGCSHYENPTEGVRPEDMWPQIDGEALNLASVLTWGPSYYFQKQFFSGVDHPLSTASRLMHYDLEVSGEPPRRHLAGRGQPPARPGRRRQHRVPADAAQRAGDVRHCPEALARAASRGSKEGRVSGSRPFLLRLAFCLLPFAFCLCLVLSPMPLEREIKLGSTPPTTRGGASGDGRDSASRSPPAARRAARHAGRTTARPRLRLRVRNDGGRSILTFKGPPLPGAMKLREEHETVAADGSALLTILKSLGFHVWFRYEKFREEFASEDVVIAIDETPVGVFVEIEGGEAHIQDTARALGRTPDEYITDSYRMLFLRHREAHGGTETDMLFPEPAGE